MNTKAVIIGGAGFIGSEVCRKLLDKGAEVLVYDNFSTGKKENLPQQADNLFIKEGDINNNQYLLKCLREFKANIVYHLAALHYIPYCDTHPQETLRVNVEGTESVLQACRKVNPDRVIFASSAAVYKIGDGANNEIDHPAPYDIYGYSKFFGERLVAQFYADTNISTFIARIFNTYGPYETNPHVIPRIIDQLRNENSSITLGNIDPKRDFVYVEDMAEALIALAQAPIDGYHLFNIGTGEEHSIEKLVNTAAEILNRSITINALNELKRPIDRMHLLANVSKINSDIGWKSRFPLKKGLKRTLDFYL